MISKDIVHLIKAAKSMRVSVWFEDNMFHLCLLYYDLFIAMMELSRAVVITNCYCRYMLQHQNFN